MKPNSILARIDGRDNCQSDELSAIHRDKSSNQCGYIVRNYI
ncbi:hypothetical protein ASAP_2857 [Asaia bogorensis]|uniref:Uncharacterized protein n=1 Tax=Asaia bogorensis TaxID=91915 RepID=A0A060QM45_9PROT|nr:hypothetical protein ASAP_2857 [Asaia bogorensis]